MTSGPSQHILPQFLQRNFAEKRRKQYYAYLYKINCETTRPNIGGIGAERNFYKLHDQFESDSHVGINENIISKYVQLLLKMDENIIQDVKIISNIIYHFETRSKFLRNEFSDSSKKLLEEIESQLKNKNVLRKFLIKNLNQFDFLQEIAIGNGLNPNNPRDILFISSGAEYILEQSMDESHELLSILIEHVKNHIIDKASKSGHINSLITPPNETPRIEMYSEFKFRYFKLENPNSFILPDTVVSFVTKNGVKPISSKDDYIECVFIPVSSNMVIIGEKHIPIHRNSKEINLIMSSCAYEYFIAKERNPEFEKMKKRIGKNAKLSYDLDVKKIVRDILAS